MKPSALRIERMLETHGRPVGINHRKFLNSHPRVPDDGRDRAVDGGCPTMQATSVIPIVFAAAGDPVGTGLVASLGAAVSAARSLAQEAEPSHGWSGDRCFRSS
jgi:hypothetical protein